MSSKPFDKALTSATLLATLFFSFCLLILGGVVHNTQSSLACPDWPLCYGQFFPEMRGGVLIEHSHRLLASFVGLLCLGLFVLGWKNRRRDPGAFKYAVGALLLVLFQGILGGITVLYKLPTIVSTFHLAVSMIFFCLLISTHHHHRHHHYHQRDPTVITNWSPSLHEGIWIATALLYAQILLGALIRHSGAGASCGLGWDNAFLCFDGATWNRSFWPTRELAKLHMLHRYLGVGTFLLSSFFCLKVLRARIGIKTKAKTKTRAGARAIVLGAIALPVLLLVQVGLGVMTLASHIGVVPTTAHLAIAAAALGLSWKLGRLLHDLENSSRTAFSHFLNLTKPRLSALVIATAFVGMQWAPVEVPFFQGFFALLSITLVVLGANALNCYMERDIDEKMERTRHRSLPAKRIPPRQALCFGVSLIALGSVGLMAKANGITALLGLLAAVLYVAVYTPLKQRSELSVYMGAVPGGIPPLLGWTAATGEVGLLPLALFAILFVWQLPHFLAISLLHARDYATANIKVYPNSKGVESTKRRIIAFTALLALSSLLPVYWGGAGTAYAKAAMVLGGSFFLLAILGKALRRSHEHETNLVWAKSYFWGSLIYLPLLLAALLFFQ